MYPSLNLRYSNSNYFIITHFKNIIHLHFLNHILYKYVFMYNIMYIIQIGFKMLFLDLTYILNNIKCWYFSCQTRTHIYGQNNILIRMTSMRKTIFLNLSFLFMHNFMTRQVPVCIFLNVPTQSAKFKSFSASNANSIFITHKYFYFIYNPLVTWLP